MKQKTAIRQLIEIIESSIEQNHFPVTKSALRYIKLKAESLEPINEHQIIDAVNHTNGSDDDLKTMTKNEIFAEPDLNLPLISENHYRLIEHFLSREITPVYRGGNVIADYRYLHEAWVKFRDLKYKGMPEQYYWYRESIANAIVYKSITEAFDELVKGIEWVNTLNKKV